LQEVETVRSQNRELKAELSKPENNLTNDSSNTRVASPGPAP